MLADDYTRVLVPFRSLFRLSRSLSTAVFACLFFSWLCFLVSILCHLLLSTCLGSLISGAPLSECFRSQSPWLRLPCGQYLISRGQFIWNKDFIR